MQTMEADAPAVPPRRHRPALGQLRHDNVDSNLVNAVARACVLLPVTSFLDFRR
jgi:hypothetical protein